MMLISMHFAPIQIKQDGKAIQQTLEPGSFFELKRGETFSMKNNGIAAAHFALLEMPR
ncbi:MAG: hypothetical protein IPP42_11595 [Saprospiraceae bacterium]|nr:hypothetical protein [Saprospiraceae bacterium]